MFEEEDPKSWEIRDEEPPEGLKRKWEREEAAGPRSVICPSCRKETPADSLTCIFCGATRLEEYCLVRSFLSWIQRLFKKGERLKS